MPGTNEAFSRVKIDAQLKDQGWDVLNPNAVRFEYVLPDKTKADYVLCDRHGRALAVIEAKRASINPAEAEVQAKAYAVQMKVPYVFLANGEEIRFWEWEREAFPRVVKTFFKQDDLERRVATRQLKRDPMTVEIDRRIVERDYQKECIDTLCREMNGGRRKLLVEMATGTGKTRTAAAFIKRLFEAHAITRVLFLVDRIPLAKQTEDAFAEHLPDYPAYVLRAGRRFQDEKRITITTLQSMINIYGEYSAGYFDLVISDECHRSIYGQWSGVLKHFDGIQVGLTATPCVSDTPFDEEEDKLFVRDTLRFFAVEKPTFTYKLKDAIRDGYLVPYQIYKAKTVKTAAEGGFEVKHSELDWSAMDRENREELEKLLREANLVELSWSQIDLERGTAWIYGDKAKGKEDIHVSLSDAAMSVLRRQIGKHPVRVFTYRGTPVTWANTRAWRKALKRVGLEDFRWHDLRHTWASWHVQHGTPLYDLQEMGGWKSEKMVRRYAHLAPANLAKHAQVVGRLLEGTNLAQPANETEAETHATS